MPEGDKNSGSSNTGEDESSGRLWQGLKALIFGQGETAQSLREQLEEAIDEHEDNDASDSIAIAGDLSPVERDMLRNLLHFSDHDADDVAVPRSDIIAVAANASFAQLVDMFSEHGHSRLPVYGESLDDIIGMVHIKDVFRIVADDCDHPEDWSDLIRQPRFVPQSMGVIDLLAEMRATRTHLAIVLDEYSGTEGIVTIEDLVEEIVGEIEDEHDEEPEELLIAHGHGIWEADARAELEDVAKLVDPSFADVEEDVDTLGGLAFVLAGQVPDTGTMLNHIGGWQLEVIETDDRRITRIKLYPPVQNTRSDADDQQLVQ